MSRAGGWLLLALAGAAACGGQGRDKPATPDSTLFGHDRERQGDSARTAPEVALLELQQHLTDEIRKLKAGLGPNEAG